MAARFGDSRSKTGGVGASDSGAGHNQYSRVIWNEKRIQLECPRDLKSQNFSGQLKKTSKNTNLDSVSGLWTT